VIIVGGKAYELVHEHKTAWNPDAFKERYSEVLDRYDYIVGDWGYNQLRLKGFFREGSNKSTKDSGIASLQDYLQEYCNFGCAYFVLERAAGKMSTPDEASTEVRPAAAADSEGEIGEGAAAPAAERPPGMTGGGGMAFSDRKPYSWREHQSTSRQRAAAAADKLEGEAKPETSAPARRKDGKPRPAQGERREGQVRPADLRDRPASAAYEPSGERSGGGHRPHEQGPGAGRKFYKGPRQGSGPNKGRGVRPDNGARDHGGRADAHMEPNGGRERTQQRHHHKPQPNQPS
jgi:uncharacterized protein YutD